MNQPELGKKIVELRQSKGLTQSELAEHCNLSLRTVQRIESGEAVSRNYTVQVILSYLGYDLNNSSIALSDDKSGKDHLITNWLERIVKYVLELFNLKRNTMTKVSVLSLVAILVFGGLFLTKNDLKAQKIEGWFLAGNKAECYKIGLDKSVYKTGGSSAFLESKCKKIEGFGTLAQTSSAEEYLGKKVKMTAWIKSRNVSDFANIWIRADSVGYKVLSFSSTQTFNPIIGDKDWSKYEVMINVPRESVTINYGIVLSGTGKVWFDDVKLEIIGNIEDIDKIKYEKPRNLDFSE